MKEHSPWADDQTAPAKANSLLAQFIRLVTRIAIEIAELLRDIRHPVMHDVMFQVCDFAGHQDMGMDLALNPTTAIAPEKPGLIIGIDSCVSHPMAQHVIFAGQAKRVHIAGD